MRKLTKGLPCIDCGNLTSGIEHKRCIKCIKKYQIGKNAPNYKGVKYFCIDCGKKLANIYAKRCRSCSSKGNKNSHFGILPNHSKRIKYNKTTFRSGWEVNFAKWLDLSGIKWDYESKTFNLGNTTYTPDFYLPEFDCYIEIKGWWRKEAKKKYDKCLKQYDELIHIFNKETLKEIGILWRSI